MERTNSQDKDLGTREERRREDLRTTQKNSQREDLRRDDETMRLLSMSEMWYDHISQPKYKIQTNWKTEGSQVTRSAGCQGQKTHSALTCTRDVSVNFSTAGATVTRAARDGLDVSVNFSTVGATVTRAARERLDVSVMETKGNQTKLDRCP